MKNVYTEAERRRLAGRGRTLRERIERPPEAPTDPPDDAREWLDEWRDRVADGDEEAFARRLAYEDVDPDAVERYLGSHEWPRGDPVPEWVHDLEAIVAFVADPETESASVTREDGEPVPFAPILGRIVAYARRTIDSGAVPGGVEDAAREAFEDWLVERLETLLSQTLFVEFKTFVTLREDESEAVADVDESADGPGTPDAGSPDADAARRTERYDEFTTGLLDEGLDSFFLEYAFLGRLLVETLRQWRAVVEEFWSRLDADRARLRAAFGDGSALGRVTDLEVLGDRHAEGRAVVGVTFESGTEVAYKPRDVRVESAFFDLLAWINARSDLPDFETLDCLRRDGYGWIEWVDVEECRTDAAVRRYYRRAGMLVGLLHATNFTDGHYENVISNGEHPVLVDVETIAQPVLPADRTVLSEVKVEVTSGSVLRTSLLPMTVSDDDSWDISGFGAADITFESVSVPEFSDVNTDAMELEFEDSYSVASDNLPRRDGEVQPPSDYAEEITRGFERMYEFLTDARADLLAPDGPLAAFEDAEIRHVHRATSTYGSILKSLRRPKYLRTGLQYGCKVEALAEPFATGSVDESLWPVYEAERAAITRLDVPRFSLETTGTDLRFDGERIVELHSVSPFDQMRQRIESLDRTDLEEQLAYLDLAFGDGSGDGLDTHADGLDAGAGSLGSVAADATLTTDGVDRAVRSVADRVAETAALNEDGDPDWYLRSRHPDGGILLWDLDAGVYAGRLGVGLFLAATSNVLGDDCHRDLAVEVVAPVRERLRSDERRPFDRGVGCRSGLGSVTYGLTKLGRLLDDGRYVEDARRAAELLTPERIRADDDYDVLGGTAGAVLGLLALYDETGDPGVRERAVTAGDHLLSSRVETDDGRRAWHTIEDGRVQTGFSHGVSGIAYALARLADATGRRRFEDAALEALAFERERYDPERQNWPDRRSYVETRFEDAWCYGRSGIGLARLGTYEAIGSDPVRRDLQRALGGLDARTLDEHDHVCCGTFGRVEFALAAGRSLGDDDHVERARRLAAGSVHRAESNGQFFVDVETDHWYNPTFFRGEAGIGYQLLRLRSPDLPSVLRWE